MKALPIVQFGNPLLRRQARQMAKQEITQSETQELITSMLHTLSAKKLGVALAAPQVGQGVAIVVIKVQPTLHRPDVEPFEAVLINPKIVETHGRRKQQWEGCISCGKGKAGLFAKVPRYTKVVVEYLDEQARSHRETFDGLLAQIAQHETDHLQGVLFVDRVRDAKTYMTYDEYVKQIRHNS